MEPKTIAIIPDYGFNPSDIHSQKQILWIKHISETQKIKINHALNGEEKKISKYKLDGYCEETKTGYEFHGCVFHGCPKCYHPETFNSIKQQTMDSLYKSHTERIDFLKKHLKNNLIEIWECEWDKQVKESIELQNFVKNNTTKPQIKPREALFGGRTNAARLHYKAEDNEKIKYIDFTSVYPFVQKTGKYPLGHPKIITEHFGIIEDYFGIIYCKILPPRKLRFPVLPHRQDGKLFFALCKKCSEEKTRVCCHNDNERALEGTWITEEVKLAVKHGYKIIKIYFIWHWDKTEQYNKSTKSGGLFTEYVNTFLKIKQEASGYPAWVITENDKNNYIQDYYENEGILLDKSKIEPNGGLKSIAKLMLNSMWGRYAMQTNKSQYKFITTKAELTNFFLNDQYVVENLNLINDHVIQLFYTKNNTMHEGSRDTNVVLAAFVTCYARMKLFKQIHLLDDRVLYYDTDSIIYISREGQYDPELGDYLGDFTNEIDGNGYITEFVSGGAKNYAYKTSNNETICKVKGLTLNYGANKIVNFESMKKHVLEDAQPLEVEQNKFLRNKNEWSIRTEETKKIYRQIYDKRILNSDFTTLPYGY